MPVNHKQKVAMDTQFLSPRSTTLDGIQWWLSYTLNKTCIFWSTLGKF